MERVLKYQEIESYMLQELSSGRFAQADRFFTETDIARQFHVTALTARKAFAQLEKKGYIVRRRGLGTFVKALPEQPQRLAMFKRCIIGIATGKGNFDNDLKLGRMLIALYRAIDEAGYLAMLAGEDPGILVEAGVHGVIALEQMEARQVRLLHQSGIPAVGMSPSRGALPGIGFDYAEAAGRMVDCFQRGGARWLAMVGEGKDALLVRNLFEQSIASEVRQRKMRLSILVPPIGSAREMLAEQMDRPEHPDALFVMNSWSLETVAGVLRERGLVPGRDVSLLVNGSNALLIPGTPGYSIVDIDVDAAARNSVRLLQCLIRDPDAECPPVLSPYGPIVDRGSLMHEDAPRRP